jgi:hypothetical protein
LPNLLRYKPLAVYLYGCDLDALYLRQKRRLQDLGYILKLFSKSKPESIRLYKRFVLQETPEEINQIFGRRNMPAVLGSKRFADRIKDKFFNLKNVEEMPETKRLDPLLLTAFSAVPPQKGLQGSNFIVNLPQDKPYGFTHPHGFSS